ncbi:MAG: FIST C-terminal domain-containing protein [Acidimicrobiia bacterium]|nr:FIST C-terminal domain-containing protein [Acidimicrobiia bacterium]
MASAGRGPGENRLLLDDEVHTDGAVGVLLPAGAPVSTVVSQGCRAHRRALRGDPLRAEQPVYELGGKAALERLQETVGALDPDERHLVENGLHVGRVIDEHRAEFGRGDFLIRNLAGADPESGAILIGDVASVGSTVQFQVRDAATADEDLRTRCSPEPRPRARWSSPATAGAATCSGSPTTTPRSWRAWCPTTPPPACSARASSGRSAGGASCTGSPPRSRSSAAPATDSPPHESVRAAASGRIGLARAPQGSTTARRHGDRHASLEQRAVDVIRGLAMDAPRPRRPDTGHGRWRWRRWPRCCGPGSCATTRGPRLARPRPVRALGRARVHPAVLAAAPDRLRPVARRPARLPPVGQPHPRPPRGAPHRRDRGHDGAARAGVRQRRGPGPRRAVAPRTASAPTCSTTTCTRICSDGDLQEGLSHEAASLAGHLGLDRLVFVYDDNHISIDGPTELALSDDPVGRFRAYGWHVVDLGEKAEDLDALETALLEARDHDAAPSLIVLRSHIGHPSPTFTDTADAHGNPLGEDEIRTVKEILGLPPDETFHVPDEVAAWFRDAAGRHRPEREAWEQRFAADRADRAELEAALAGRGLEGWASKLPSWDPGEKVATRKASGACFNAVLDVVPGLLGGGADLTGNTGTELADEAVQSRDAPGGRQIHFGVREHAMGAVMNGMGLHGGVLPVGGTFFVFSDYMRPSVRLAALSGIHRRLLVDPRLGRPRRGRPHPPARRAPRRPCARMPGLRVVRPADANETATAWRTGRRRTTARWPWCSPARAPGARGHPPQRGRPAGGPTCSTRARATPSCCSWARAARWRSAVDAADRLADRGH